MRSGNPALNSKAFETFDAVDSSRTMTVEGTAIKTGVLLVCVVVPAAFSWNQYNVNPGTAGAWMWGGFIGGLILAIVTIFKKQWSPVTAPLYAVAEGLFLGALSAMYSNHFYPGIVPQAVGLTFGTLFSLLIAYQTGWIRASENFKLGVFAATGGIGIVYLVSFVMRMFGTDIPLIHGNGLVGIGFSLFVVVVAALNLVLDFDFIEKGAEYGAPKYMEWYGAFGLMVTLVWLYIEILRLLSKLSSRR